MAISLDIPLGMANRFQLIVHAPGDIDLGTWSKVSGLDVTWDVAEYRAGDAGNDRWYHPGNTKYSEVSLSRAACEDTKKLKDFLSAQSFGFKGGYSASIKLLDSAGKPLKGLEDGWEMRDFMPKKWAIDGFEAGKSSVVLETFQFTHMGFLADEVKLG